MRRPRKAIFSKSCNIYPSPISRIIISYSRLHLVRRSFILRDRYFFHGVRKKINEFQCVILSTKNPLVRCKRNCVSLAAIYNVRIKDTAVLNETKCNISTIFFEKINYKLAMQESVLFLK